MSGQNPSPPQPPWPPQGGPEAYGPGAWSPQPQGQQPPPYPYGQVPGQPPGQPAYGHPPGQPGYGQPPGQPSGQPVYGQAQAQPFDPASAARNAGDWANGLVKRHGLRTILHVAVPVLVILGLIMPTTFLIKNLAWAAFAIGVALGSLVGRRDSAKSWTIAAACSGGLFLYWVLIALPSITSFGGFLMTAAVVVAGYALWIHPQRKWV